MSNWRGLIVAGGTGSRLAPLTRSLNKHLLPVYDKPMIYYPLTLLMLAGVREIVLVTTPGSVSQFESLLADGSQWGLNIVYRIQKEPRGIADGLRVAEADLKGGPVMMILGDNIFFGSGLPAQIEKAMAHNPGATVFGYEVPDPSAFGVVSFGPDGEVLDIEEKPVNPRSRIAVTGLYLYAGDVFDRVARLAPSARGELEITDLNRAYLADGRLAALSLGRGIAWLDGGTPKDLYEAGQFVQVLQDRTGLYVACPEEIALRRGFIDRAAYRTLAGRFAGSAYGAYLARVLEDPYLPA